MLRELIMALLNNPGNVFCKDNEENVLNYFELNQVLHPGEKVIITRIISIASIYHEILAFTKQYRNVSFTEKKEITETDVKNRLKLNLKLRNKNKLCNDCHARLIDYIKENFIHLNVNNIIEKCRKEIEIDNENEDIDKEGNEESERNQNDNELSSGMYLRAFCEGLDEALEPYRNEVMALEQIVLSDPDVSITFILCKMRPYNHLLRALKEIYLEVQRLRVNGCLIMDVLRKHYHRSTASLQSSLMCVIRKVNRIFFKQTVQWILFGQLCDPNEEFFITSANKTYMTTIYENRKIKRQARKEKDFDINLLMLPTFIDFHIAKSILFVGKTMELFLTDSRVRANKDSAESLTIWSSKVHKQIQKFRALEEQLYDNVTFQRALEDTRIYVTEHLGKLIMKDANICKELQLIRDFILLGRGDFYEDYIIDTKEFLEKAVFDVPSNALKAAFEYILDNANIPDETIKEKFCISVYSINEDADKNDTALSRIGINYYPVWPLELIFTENALKQYSVLFRLLLHIKKTEMELNNLWLQHSFRKIKMNVALWMLRMKCSFLINNLLYYLQADVIESHFCELINEIKSTNDFDKIVYAHDKFLQSIMSESFLFLGKPGECFHDEPPTVETNPVLFLILRILDLTSKFCTAVGSWSAELTELENSELSVFTNNIDESIFHLMNLWNNLHDAYKMGRQLTRLLSRLEYDNWFKQNTSRKVDFIPHNLLEKDHQISPDPQNIENMFKSINNTTTDSVELNESNVGKSKSDLGSGDA